MSEARQSAHGPRAGEMGSLCDFWQLGLLQRRRGGVRQQPEKTNICSKFPAVPWIGLGSNTHYYAVCARDFITQRERFEFDLGSTIMSSLPPRLN